MQKLMLILVYSNMLEEFKDKQTLFDRVYRLRLKQNEYAIVEGSVIKDFDDMSYDIEIRRMQHK